MPKAGRGFTITLDVTLLKPETHVSVRTDLEIVLKYVIKRWTYRHQACIFNTDTIQSIALAAYQ